MHIMATEMDGNFIIKLCAVAGAAYLIYMFIKDRFGKK